MVEVDFHFNLLEQLWRSLSWEREKKKDGFICGANGMLTNHCSELVHRCLMWEETTELKIVIVKSSTILHDMSLFKTYNFEQYYKTIQIRLKLYRCIAGTQVNRLKHVWDFKLLLQKQKLNKLETQII